MPKISEIADRVIEKGNFNSSIKGAVPDKILNTVVERGACAKAVYATLALDALIFGTARGAAMLKRSEPGKEVVFEEPHLIADHNKVSAEKIIKFLDKLGRAINKVVFDIGHRRIKFIAEDVINLRGYPESVLNVVPWELKVMALTDENRAEVLERIEQILLKLQHTLKDRLDGVDINLVLNNGEQADNYGVTALVDQIHFLEELHAKILME